MSKLTWLLLAVVLGGIVLKSLVSALEPRLVFFPTPGEDATPESLGLRYARVSLTTSDGEQLAAWQLSVLRSLNGEDYPTR